MKLKYAAPFIFGSLLMFSATAPVFGSLIVTANPNGFAPSSLVYTPVTLGPVGTTNPGVVQGSSGIYADPVTGGTVANPTFYSGPYISTGLGTYTLNLSGFQGSLDLLWGSVDPSNLLTLVNSQTNVVVGSISGAQLSTLTGVPANGSTTFGGSDYVRINSTLGFDRIVLSSGQISFEAAAFATAPAPEPGSYILMGLGLSVLSFVGMRRRRNGVSAS